MVTAVPLLKIVFDDALGRRAGLVRVLSRRATCAPLSQQGRRPDRARTSTCLQSITLLLRERFAAMGLFERLLFVREPFDAFNNRFVIHAVFLSCVACDHLFLVRRTDDQCRCAPARTGFGSGTWGISALGGMTPSLPAWKSSERLDNLGTGVHHEGSVVLHVLADRLAAEDEELHVRPCASPAARLRRRAANRPDRTPQVGPFYRTTFAANEAGAREDVDERVERRIPRQVKLRARRDRHVGHGHGRMRRARPALSRDVPRDHTHSDSPSGEETKTTSFASRPW